MTRVKENLLLRVDDYVLTYRYSKALASGHESTLCVPERHSDVSTHTHTHSCSAHWAIMTGK